MRDGPKLLEDHFKQLKDLMSIVRLVEEEKVLQTAEIGEQLIRVQEIAQELQKYLECMTTLQKKSTVRQYLRNIGTGEQKEKELRGIMDRLAQAKTDLSMRIQLAHVGLSGTLRDGFVTFLPTIQRIDQSVQRVLDSRLAVAAQLEPRLASQRGVYVPDLVSETLLLNGDEQKALGLNIDHHLTVQSNSAFEEADQVNMIAGAEKSQRAVKAEISNNIAKDKSKQRNFIIDALTFEKFPRASLDEAESWEDFEYSPPPVRRSKANGLRASRRTFQ